VVRAESPPRRGELIALICWWDSRETGTDKGETDERASAHEPTDLVIRFKAAKAQTYLGFWRRGERVLRAPPKKKARVFNSTHSLVCVFFERFGFRQPVLRSDTRLDAGNDRERNRWEVHRVLDVSWWASASCSSELAREKERCFVCAVRTCVHHRTFTVKKNGSLLLSHK